MKETVFHAIKWMQRLNKEQKVFMSIGAPLLLCFLTIGITQIIANILDECGIWLIGGIDPTDIAETWLVWAVVCFAVMLFEIMLWKR